MAFRSIDSILLTLVPVLTFVLTVTQRHLQTDFWHHLARGRAIVERGEIVNVDLFTFTVAGQPLRDPNWLTQILYHGLFSSGGMGMVRLVDSLTVSAAVGLLVVLCWRASGSARVAAALGTVALLGLWQVLIIRPQSISLLLFGLLFLALDASDRRRGWLLLPPVLVMLWTNMHGGFPIALVLVGTFFLASILEGIRDLGWGFWRSRRIRDLALCLGGCLAATLVSPYGWHIYDYVGVTAASARARGIVEWLPPDLNELIGRMWAFSLVVTLVACSLPGRRPTVRDLCLLGCFLPLSCAAVRMVAWWLLVSLPVVAAQLGGCLPRSWLKESDAASESPWIARAFVVVLLLVVLVCVPGVEQYLPIEPKPSQLSRPERDLAAIAETMREQPTEGKNLYSRFEWGEFLAWDLHPDGYRVFMDGRNELISDDLFAEYLAVMNARADWREILDRHAVAWLVLDLDYPPHRDQLLPALQRSSQWREVQRSGAAILYSRAAANEGRAEPMSKP